MNVRREDLHRSPRLPVELEQEIFQTAAASFPKCVPELLLVARRVRKWLEPELYRVIRSGDGKVIPPLYIKEREGDNDVLDIDRLRKYGCHVRHVLLQNKQSQEIGDVLKHCPKVYNLALWIINGPCEHLIPIIEGLSLRILSFDPSYFFGGYDWDAIIPFDQPLFHNLTHLEIINVTSIWSKWEQLASLSKLTHLALAGIASQEFIDRVLVECKALKFFVIFHSDIDHLIGEVDFPQRDHRVVFLQTVADHLEHWERGARGEEDFWITAERCKQEAMKDGHRTSTSDRGKKHHENRPPR